MRLFPFLLVLTIGLIRPAAADEFLPGVKRIVFLGDSITYAGGYVDRFETFLRTQFPRRDFEVIDCGLPSETVSGLSEEGHAGGKFPRPGLHERLDRVLAKTKPDLIFACYGMNDGIYLPFAEDRFERFAGGMRKLRAKAEAAGVKVIHLTPPLFDPLPIKDRVVAANQVDAGHPFKDYDDVLTRYSAWLIEQRAEGWQVIDIHGPMTTALAARRALAPGFTFAGDGVHADARGHAVIADALIEGLQPGEERIDSFEHLIDGEWSRSADGISAAKAISKRRSLLSNAWLTETGHLRPGMAKGLPLDEAAKQASELDREIRLKLPPPLKP